MPLARGVGFRCKVAGPFADRAAAKPPAGGPGTTMDTDSLVSLLDFLPRFLRGDFAEAREHYQKTGEYIPAVGELSNALTSANLLPAFDWTTWKDGNRYARDPSLVRTADLVTVGRILTTIVRQDRFVGGLLPRVCSSGMMQTLLERLAELSRDPRASGGEGA
jgi:hypothetical protein